MRELFSLGARLQKCAEYVREGSRFADIGSDHGYLPIWLMLSGRITSAVAADIGEGPLSSAESNSRKYHCSLKTVLSDGFEKISPEETDDAVIAGMGGGLMISIISAAPWLKDESKHLILQPMTAVPELRKYLSENCFAILKEEAVLEDGKVYSVMSAKYSPGNSNLSETELHMGKIVPGSEHSREYAEKTVKQLSNQLKGLVHRGLSDEADAMRVVIEKITAIYIHKGERNDS